MCDRDETYDLHDDDCSSGWRNFYHLKDPKKVWRAFNSRNIIDGALIQPQQNLLYYTIDYMYEVCYYPWREEKITTLHKQSTKGDWLIDFKDSSAFEALIHRHQWKHMHFKIYSIFSPNCANNDVEKLLAYFKEKNITMDIYFANIHGFRINKPEKWCSKNSVADTLKLRRLAKHKQINKCRIFGRDEWKFIADKLGKEILYKYKPKPVEEIWNKKTYGDEEYADVWKAVMENSLGELRHKIWPGFPLPGIKIEKTLSRCKYQHSADIFTDKEFLREDNSEESCCLFAQDYNKYIQENFSRQKGVGKRNRTIGRNEWKKISREATILANLE